MAVPAPWSPRPSGAPTVLNVWHQGGSPKEDAGHRVQCRSSCVEQRGSSAALAAASEVLLFFKGLAFTVGAWCSGMLKAASQRGGRPAGGHEWPVPMAGPWRGFISGAQGRGPRLALCHLPHREPALLMPGCKPGRKPVWHGRAVPPTPGLVESCRASGWVGLANGMKQLLSVLGGSVS